MLVSSLFVPPEVNAHATCSKMYIFDKNFVKAHRDLLTKSQGPKIHASVLEPRPQRKGFVE